MKTLSAADVISAARMVVHGRHPYLSHTLFALRPHPVPGLGTMAVDAGWRLLYDPEIVLSWQIEMEDGKLRRVGGMKKEDCHDGVAAVVFHELGHVLRDHLGRRQGRNPEAWNQACDREINDDVLAAGWVLPGGALMPSDVGMKDGLLAEEYFQDSPPGRHRLYVSKVPGCGGKCGGAAGNPTAAEGETLDPNAPTGLSAEDKEIITRRTALAIAEHARQHGRGTIPAGLQAWAQTKLRRARIDWRRKLASLTRGCLASVAGASDFTWQRTGRRSLHSSGCSGWPIAPAFHQPTPRVAVVLDTSGSMSCGVAEGRTRQDSALSEVVGLALSCGAGVDVVACDADVQAIARIGRIGDLMKVNKGGGGTSMAPGFLAARRLRPKPNLIVIVTDGEVGDGWPSFQECRGIKMLAVLVGEQPQKPPGHIAFVEVDS